MGSLSSLYISQSYQSLIHLGTNNTASANLIDLQDGVGNSIGVSVNTGGDLSLVGNLTASLQQGYVWVGNSMGKTITVPTSSFIDTFNSSSLVTTSSFNAYTSSTNNRLNNLESTSASVNISIANINSTTASQAISISNLNTFSQSANTQLTNLSASQSIDNTKWDTLGGQTGSYVTSAITASSLVTASVNLNTITFTKGDASTFNIIVNTGSAQTTDITSLNAFTASQFVSNSFFATTGSNTFVGNQTLTGSLFISGNINMVNGADLVTHHVRAQGSNGLELQTAAGAIIVSMGAGGGTQAAFTGAVTANSISASTITGIGNVTDYSASVDNRLDQLQAATSSYVTSAITASSLVTASFSGNTLTFTKGDSSTFGVVIPDVSGSTINTGSFATTGSNVFTGIQTFQDAGLNATSLVSTSGSLMLVAKSFTSASSHLSASTSTQVNLIFKNNSNTADTIISGSNNIFTNPTAPTAGFKRYIGGSGNLMLSPGAINQISASQAFPITTNFNIHTAGVITTRAAASASAWNINQNMLIGNITIGSTAANNAEKILGSLTINNNQVGNSLSIIANRTAISASTTISNNALIGGASSLTMASSSIGYTANVGNVQIINGFQNAGATTGNNNLQVSSNWFGGAYINVSGSDAGGLTNPRYIGGNYLFNGFALSNANIANLSLNGSGSAMLSTMMMGHELGITGSNGYDSNNNILTPGIGAGSAFFGRWNSQSGNRARTAETVFAIGTGTSTSLTKTGFLIDSGSNTFVEGTFNVSGSSTFTGSLNGLNLTRGPGNNNTGLGSGVLQNAVSGGNVALGASALQANTSGTDNVALGDSTLFSNISGDRNIAIGSNTLDSNTTGTLNVGIGNATLAGLVDGTSNTGIGFEALKNQTTGSYNTGVGNQTLNQNISGSYNIAIGASAGYNETSSNNFYLTNNNFGSINADRSGSLMWGKMDNTTANQTLQINARTRFTNEVLFTTGSNQQAGTAVLDGGNPGAVTVSNSLVTANSIIMVSKQTLAHPNGYVAVSAKSAGSFTITSNHNGDSDTVGWFIINNS